MTNIVEIKNLCKYYKDFRLENVGFDIPKGYIVGLIGENGAGKSTTIKAMLNLINADSGEITFWDRSLAAVPAMKEDIGVVFDDLYFYNTLTVKEIGRINAFAYKQWDKKIFNSYVSRFALPMDKALKDLSKGMKMKLSIALALSHRPKLLILDEATAGLDPVMRDDILDVFLDFVQDEEHAILMSTHITSDLEKVADHIIFIHEGKILLNMPKDELIYNYGIIRCAASQFMSIAKEDILCSRKEEYQYSVLVADKAKAKQKYKDLTIDNATIEEIMLLYVKGER